MMRYARNTARIGSIKTAIRAASGSANATNAAKSIIEGAKHRFTDEQKAQAVKMCAEGMRLSATARVVGASVPTVSNWVRKGCVGYRAFDAISVVADKRSAE